MRPGGGPDRKKVKKMVYKGSHTVGQNRLDPGGGRLRDQAGFSLVEMLAAVVILGLAIAPMIQAFMPTVASISQQEETSVFIHQARATLCRVAALDFDTLDHHQGNPVDLAALFGSAGEAAKETFAFRGESLTPSVAITDASGGAGGLLLLGASVGGVHFTLLKANR